MDSGSAARRGFSVADERQPILKPGDHSDGLMYGGQPLRKNEREMIPEIAMRMEEYGHHPC